MTFSRAEAGKLELALTQIDLIDFCNELVEEIQHSVSSNHTVSFNYQYQESSSSHQTTKVERSPLATIQRVPLVDMDEKLLRNILVNLLSNAIKYSPSGGDVLFAVTYFDGPRHLGEDGFPILEQNSRHVVFTIQDYGIGILPEEQDKIFDSFHRGMNVGSISGTGLGLAIVKRSLDLHGGKITVSSQVGSGTAITVAIPL